MQNWKRLLCVVLAIGIILSLAACGPQQSAVNLEDDMSKEVTLKWYISMAKPARADEVMVEVNKYLKEKLNAQLDLQFINPGDYVQKMQMIMSSQEEYDLCFTSNWNNNYTDNVRRGAYLEIDELLDQVPALRDFYTDGMWEAVEVNGLRYAVPNNQVMYTQQGWWFKKDEVEKYNLDVEGIKNFEDMGKVFQVIVDNTDLMATRTGYPTLFLPMDTEVPATNLFIVDGKVTNREAETLEGYKAMRDWYLNGYFPADIQTGGDETGLMMAGKVFSRYNRPLPGAEAKHEISYPYSIVQIETNEPALTRSGIQGALTGISATSKNPIRALKLLELLHTDKYLFNLICYGIEGEDWTRVGDTDHIERDSSGYYVQEFQIGNQFLGYFLPGYTDTVWEETDEGNRTAKVDENMGFDFDPTPISNEIANLSATNKEFNSSLNLGLDDPEVVLAKRAEKAKASGVDKVVAEVQRQYDEWKKTQK